MRIINWHSNNYIVWCAVGSHQATLKELSRVRHELLKAKTASKSLVQQARPETDCTETLLPHQMAAEPQSKCKEKHTLQQSERLVSHCSWSRSSNSQQYSYLLVIGFQYIHLVNTICQNLPEVEKPVLSELTMDGELNDRLEQIKQRKQVLSLLNVYIIDHMT